MWPAEAITLSATILVVITSTRSLPLAVLFLAAWALSPLIAFYVSRHRPDGVHEFAAKHMRAGRRVARRTWRFFETFVGDEDHWLPPDNFQEDPRPVIVHRTSPTNIGLLLLSTRAAYDFGYLGLNELTERIEFTLGSLGKLQKFRGHFLNWHDTVALTPLWPQYVSVVDSGNLAGHLIALKQACLELPDHPLCDARMLSGLTDTVAALKQEASQLAAIRQRTEAVTMKQLRDEIDSCAALAASEPPETLRGWTELFDGLFESAGATDDIVGALAHEQAAGAFDEVHWWTGSLIHEVRGYQDLLQSLTPWVAKGTLDLGSPDKDAAAQWRVITEKLGSVPSLAELPELCDRALVHLAALRDGVKQDESDNLSKLTHTFEKTAEAAKNLLSRLAKI